MLSCPYDVLDALQRAVWWLGVLVAAAGLVVGAWALGLVWAWAFRGGDR